MEMEVKSTVYLKLSIHKFFQRYDITLSRSPTARVRARR